MSNPIIRYEAGQTPHPFESLDNAGDDMVFGASFSPWSNAAGFEPVVAPYGLLTGGGITPATANDTVDVAALTASMAGVNSADADGVVSVSGDSLTVDRAATETHMINSITVDDAGVLAVVSGTEGTSFTETRGEAGGPPYIPVGSIEIGQVRLSSADAAAIESGEIYTVPGLHVERADYPVYEVDYARGEVHFATELPTIHTGDMPKMVYARAATPLFAPIPQTSEYTPSESTYSITSTDTYDGPVGSASSSLGQMSFNAVLKDGITDQFVQQKGRTLWFEFRPDRDRSVPRQLTQGILGISRSFPAGGGNFSASCTVTPQNETLDVTE